MSDDDFDPVVANSGMGSGLAIMYNDKTIKNYKNVWAIFAVDSEDPETSCLITTDVLPNQENVEQLITEKTGLENFYWITRLATYYIGHVSRSFENLFISAWSRKFENSNFAWDSENEEFEVLNEPEFKLFDDQGFFGHGGWTSALKLD